MARADKKIFVVYLTIYKGNKLPPFYLGATSLEKIKNGYRGSVSSITYKSIWKTEIKNHPDLFETKIIKSFEAKSDAFLYEEKIQRQFKVHKNPLYINMSVAGYLYNLTDEMRKIFSYKISKSRIGIKFSEEHKKNLSISHKGQVPWNKGKKMTDEYKKKISDVTKGRRFSPETRLKLSEKTKEQWKKFKLNNQGKLK